ncbi:hypothetical protein E1162_15205 [Rhodobacteraceae bacterium RKSG542]|uniref:hypothetical protein n=1 Tax=Pseudovibrio flavus TaxID=2529854 RepID=UPI0012BC9299|nr:hypothetical protein [Pseudovibrio flavus]MTI18591.1 hypothetical protein [Pseudovibrio flavus]
MQIQLFDARPIAEAMPVDASISKAQINALNDELFEAIAKDSDLRAFVCPKDYADLDDVKFEAGQFLSSALLKTKGYTGRPVQRLMDANGADGAPLVQKLMDAFEVASRKILSAEAASKAIAALNPFAQSLKEAMIHPR